MATLRSKTNYKGESVNGILLGEPVILTTDLAQATTGDSVNDLWFCWDDSALPSGVMLDGQIIPDGAE